MVMGRNFHGQLGNGSRNMDYNVAQVKPQKIYMKEENKFIEISAGYSHCLAIDINGKLWSWGNNQYGQLGDGTNVDKYIINKVEIPEEIKFNKIMAGYGHSLAIDEHGNLWSWGNNQYGQLGDGTIENKETPVKIMEGIKEATVGYQYSLAIDINGNLWSWGNNKCGQLGDGTIEDKHSPIKIMRGIKEISAGYRHVLAVDNNNVLWSWGDNSYGQLGDGTTTESVVPKKLS